jgi:4-hydroxy-tetrahydrodipicolinate reductase
MVSTVLVHGVTGKMGMEVIKALCSDDTMLPVGGVSRNSELTVIDLPNGSTIPHATNVEEAIKKASLSGDHPKVLVDFTNANAAMIAIRTAAPHGIDLVVGSTGFTTEHYNEIDQIAKEYGIGVVLASNFALGAVVLTHLARLAGQYFSHADIIEMHHEAKVDSPSGTAITLASALGSNRSAHFTRPLPAREPVSETRGGDINGISVHSIRMPGKLAHHQIILGIQGQTLSLSHDTLSRECYMPGVIQAIDYVQQNKHVTIGLDPIIGLE